MSVWRVNRAENLQDVFDTAPEGTIICLPAGEIRQKAVLRTANITLLGQGADRTRIVFDDCARSMDKTGRPQGTFRSFTLAVTAPHVTMRHLTIANDAGDPAQRGQQVALSVYGDDFLMEDCALTSTQDTLFLGPLPPDLLIRYKGLLPEALCRGGALRSRFLRCRIEGSVDFIFGGGQALFEGCQIVSVADGRQVGYVAAPSHGPNQTEGFHFKSCRFLPGLGVAPASVYLARPWRDHGLAIFDSCAYGLHIHPAGFDKWGTSHRDETARFREYPPISSRPAWINRE